MKDKKSPPSKTEKFVREALAGAYHARKDAATGWKKTGQFLSNKFQKFMWNNILIEPKDGTKYDE